MKDPRYRDGRTQGALPVGHWIKVTVYRFQNWREEAAGSDQAGGGVLPLHAVDQNRNSSLRRYGAFNPDVYETGTVFTFGSPPDWASVRLKDRFVGTILAFSNNKTLASVSGTFTIRAKLFGEWPGAALSSNVLDDDSIAKWVDAGDWVEVNVVKSDPRLGPDIVERTLMVGKVDTVGLSMAISGNGDPQGTVTITGRDAGGVFEDIPLYFNQYDPAHSNAEGITMSRILGNEGLISGSPTELVTQMLGLVGESGANLGLAPLVPDRGLWTQSSQESVEFRDVFSVGFAWPTRGVIHAPTILGSGDVETPLWEFTKTYGNPDFNEMWVDTAPMQIGANNHDSTLRKVYFHMREKPFVNVFQGQESTWFSLKLSVLNTQEIVDLSLSRGVNRVNHVQALFQLDPVFNYDAMVMCPPAVNFKSIRKYGLKTLQVTMPILATNSDGGGMAAMADEIKQWRDLLISWNLLNPYYWAGMITVVGIRADIRVGDKIVVEGGPVDFWPQGPFTNPGDNYTPSPGWNGAANDANLGRDAGDAFTAYVEAVQYSWSSGLAPKANTRITISRGYQESKRVSDIQALYGQWEDVTAATARTIAADETDTAAYDEVDGGRHNDGTLSESVLSGVGLSGIRGSGG